mmetsp:Transcript_83860/g.234004  ORF Transcript_83860/g.234004 Transcript_83860/m.234004 type:complete len:80 (+) Transcript_83860:981-1220(+)
MFFNPFYSLRDIFVGCSNSSNSQENIIFHKISCKALDLIWECGRKHEGLTINGHTFILNNSTNLRLKAHIQHSICFIKY